MHRFHFLNSPWSACGLARWALGPLDQLLRCCLIASVAVIGNGMSGQSIFCPAACVAGEPPGWALRVIDDTSEGADGVKLADIDGDGRLDIVTGWEEGNEIRLYLQPEPSRVRDPWPRVTVGRVNSPEDAFYFDANGNGRLDVISCCEGRERTMFVHLAPPENEKLLVEEAWRTVPLRESVQATSWMFGIPFPGSWQSCEQPDTTEQVTRILCGSKNPRGRLGYFEFANAEQVSEAVWTHIRDAAWIMSLEWCDIDGDGLLDLVFSDRMGEQRGCWVRRNPGTGASPAEWPEFPIGGQGREVMFLTTCDLNGNGLPDVLCPDRGAGFLVCVNESQPGEIRFRTLEIPRPPETGTGKCIAAGDINRDGQLDFVITCEHAQGKHGAYWLQCEPLKDPAAYTLHPISGKERGVKYDLIELIDLNGDGWLDVLTCEERDNLGVIWYENPARPTSSP